jgi:glycosyltransferase involved in cell wall biosynthesis
MLNALEKVCWKVQPLVPFSDSAMRFSYLYARKANRLIGRYEPAHLNSLVVRASRARLRALLAPSDLDAVIGVAASTLVSAVPDRLPAIYLSDATFRLLQNYYAKFSNLPAAIASRADQFEQEAINRADALVFSSQWAADSAIQHYGADPQKISIVPFGASLPSIPEPINRSMDGESVHLLFIGVEWFRKGASTAVEAAASLQRQGISASLTIVGCTPPEGVTLPPYVTNIPYLSKTNQSNFQTLDRLFRAADFFILPTTAECTPIVFCEAAAYSLPALATDTGGVGSVVLDGVSGCLVPEGSTGSDYATLIMKIMETPGLYPELARNSRCRFDKVLNWNQWAKTITGIAHSLQR